MVWGVKGGVEILGGKSVFPMREGAERVCHQVVKVKITCDKVRVQEGENIFGRY